MFETTSLPDDILFETVDCDLCGTDDVEDWDVARLNTLSRCGKCGLVFTNPRIKNVKEKNSILYGESYFQQKSRMTEKMIKARKKTHWIEINELKKFVKGGRVLDVGCGMGMFLDSFGSEWEKHGCDISSYALNIAREKGIYIYPVEFEKFGFKKEFFDVVYFRASLHHTYSPKKCLENAYAILKPDGVIAICMSNNSGGVSGRLFKGHIKSYEQGHNYLFSRRVLENYLKILGLKIVNVSYPYFGTGYASYRDFIEIIFLYAKYLHLRFSSRLNKPENRDFSSPTFYGNYINIYARKENLLVTDHA